MRLSQTRIFCAVRGRGYQPAAIRREGKRSVWYGAAGSNRTSPVDASQTPSWADAVPPAARMAKATTVLPSALTATVSSGPVSPLPKETELDCRNVLASQVLTAKSVPALKIRPPEASNESTNRIAMGWDD